MPRETGETGQHRPDSNFTIAASLSKTSSSTSLLQGSNSEGVALLPPLRNLVKESSRKDFQCDRCSRVFTRRENLARHAKSHDHSKYHQCSVCGKGFSRRDMLSRHEAGHERWDQQNPSVSHSRGPRKRRKVAFEDDATRSTNSDDPAPEYGEREVPEQRMRNQNLYQTISPGLTAHADLPASSGYQFDHSNAIQPMITQHSPKSTSGPSGSQEVPSSNVPNPFSFQLPDRQESPVDLPSTQIDEPSPLASFDFSAFLLPPNNGDSGGFSYDWFSNDFYSAMKETGNEDLEFSNMLDLNFQSPNQFGQYSASSGEIPLWEQHSNLQRGTAPDDGNDEDIVQQTETLSQSETGRISRISSPPNEASEEDKWPFAWNPRSRPILRANRVTIPDGHPLWRKHNTRFDITESTFRRTQEFVNPRLIQGFARNYLELPSLPEVNIFINLFFERFSPQAPVLHHATVNTNDDLPSPLLAAMIVIGAIHSRLPGTRRFSIVLLDIVRWNLQTLIECDNTLMREPMIIFAEALVCHAGLWCGNKRAFELAEVVRSIAVKHIRSAQFWRGNTKPVDHEKSGGSTIYNTKAQWQNWIAKESQKRLFWVIYALDAQFAGLMYLPATIAIGEVRNLCCPCDEEFWSAPTARHWKNLLGDATVPPSRTFSGAMAPFAQPFAGFRPSNSTANSSGKSILTPVLNLNAWSTFLVLATLQVQIFNFSQENLFAGSMIIEDDTMEVDTQACPEYDDNASVGNAFQQWQKLRRENLLESLSLWETTYLSNTSWQDRYPTSTYFRHASKVCYPIALILLDISFSDLQNAIGKDGSSGISEAMSNLRRWVKSSPRIAEDITYTATKTIATPLSTLIPKTPGPTAYEQATIAVFLCHIVVWIFASVAGTPQKQSMLARLAQNEELWKSKQIVAFRQALEFREDGIGPRMEDSPQLPERDVLGNIFKSAAQSLTYLGTWGAALNLALLLHRRAEMQ